MTRHRVRSSMWPYAAAAIVLGVLNAWLMFGRGHDVTQVRLPDSTTIVVTKTTTVDPKVLLPDTIGATAPTPTTTTTTTTTTSTPTTSTPTTSTLTTSTLTTSTLTTNAASQAPVPNSRTATVLIVDASGQRSLAARTEMRLLLTGWPSVATTGADQPATRTRVLTVAGFEDEGRTVAADLGLAVAVEPLTDPAAFGDATTDIVVVLGQAAAG